MDDDELFAMLYNEPEDETEFSSAVVCKYCGKCPLYWELKKEKWVLVTKSGRKHKCKETTEHKKQWSLGYEKIIAGAKLCQPRNVKN
jgi:hypothetical protein